MKKVFFCFIFILPFIFFTKSFFSYAFLKSIFTEGIVIVLFTLFLINFLFKKEKVWVSIVFLPFFTYIFFVLISFLNSFVPILSFWGSIHRGTGTVFVLAIFLLSFLISNILRTKEDWRQFFMVFIYSEILFTIGTFLSKVFVNFFSNYGLSITGGFTFSNSTYAGFYLAFVFFVSLGLFFYSETKFQKSLSILGMITVFINPIISGFLVPSGKLAGEARTAFYSILIGIFVFILFYFFKKIPSVLWKKIFIGFLISVFMFSVIFVCFHKPNPIRQFMVESGAGPNRLVFWDMAIKGFKERPLFGWGYDTFFVVSAKYFNPIIATPGYLKEETAPDRAHGMFFDELVSTGLFGTISLFSLYVILLFSLVLKFIKENTKESFLYLAIFIGLVSFLIQGIMFFQTNIGWVILSIIIAFASNFCFKNIEVNFGEFIVSLKRRMIFSVFLVILSGLGIFYLVINPFIATYRLKQLYVMNTIERLNTYKSIPKTYVGNTYNLSDVFSPFYDGTSKMILSNKNMSEKNKQEISNEVKEVINILENGSKIEKDSDIRLLLTVSGFYSILSSLNSGEEKIFYYNKSMEYINIMKKISPENPLNEIAKKKLESLE